MEAIIKWFSNPSNEFPLILLNPKLDQNEKDELQSLTRRFFQGNDCVWLASSGTQQKKDESLKIIALEKKAFFASAKAVNAHLQAVAQDKWALALPLFHVGGLSIYARSIIADQQPPVVFSSKWNPQQFVELVKNNQVTLTSLVPTQVFDLVQNQLTPPPSLRAVVVGGSALPRALYFSARNRGWPLLPSYGLTEAGSQVATADLGSLGFFKEIPRLKILKHVEIKISSEGLIQLKGNSLLKGFAQWKNKLSSKEALWCHHSMEDYFTTQDLGFIENDFLAIKGRSSDDIKILGERVHLGLLKEILNDLIISDFPQLFESVRLITDSHERNQIQLVLQISMDSTINENGNQDIKFENLNQINLDVSSLLRTFNQKVRPFERIQRAEITYEALPRTFKGSK